MAFGQKQKTITERTLQNVQFPSTQFIFFPWPFCVVASLYERGTVLVCLRRISAVKELIDKIEQFIYVAWILFGVKRVTANVASQRYGIQQREYSVWIKRQSRFAFTPLLYFLSAQKNGIFMKACLCSQRSLSISLWNSCEEEKISFTTTADVCFFGGSSWLLCVCVCVCNFENSANQRCRHRTVEFR